MNEEEPIYYKIFQRFFSENSSNSPDIMRVAFQEVLKYLEHLNKVLVTGTEEEKKKAIFEYKELRRLIAEKVERFKAEKNLSDDQFQKIMNDPASYKKEDWEVIEDSKEELKSIPDLKKNIERHAPIKKAKKKTTKSKDKWLKS